MLLETYDRVISHPDSLFLPADGKTPIDRSGLGLRAPGRQSTRRHARVQPQAPAGVFGAAHRSAALSPNIRRFLLAVSVESVGNCTIGYASPRLTAGNTFCKTESTAEY